MPFSIEGFEISGLSNTFEHLFVPVTAEGGADEAGNKTDKSSLPLWRVHSDVGRQNIS